MINVELIHGDCLEIMPALTANSVQLVFADLPYGILKPQHWDIPIDLNAFWKQCERLRDARAPCVLTSTFKFGSILLQSNFANFSYDLVYEKKLCSTPLHAKRRPLPCHEHILVFYGACLYNPQMRPENERAEISLSWRQKQPDIDKFYKKKWMGGSRMSGPMYPRSVIKPLCEDKKSWLHPTQKPVALLEWLIKTYTKFGDTVLDPVMGSGSCGVACINTGRNFIGIEKDKEYFDTAMKRINEAQSQPRLAI